MKLKKIFENLIKESASKGASDLHFTGGQPAAVRKSGEVFFVPDTYCDPQEIDLLVNDILNDFQKQKLKTEWSVDLAREVNGVRVRMNIFSTIRGLSLAIRILPGKIPTVDELNLHPCVREFAELRSGLILICGPTGSGKSTTIASMLNHVNRVKSAHVVTIEDPIEYRYKSRRAFVEQRELGVHVPSFEKGLEDVLRQAPDVIMVGEIRDPNTIRLTLNAAASGHLVITTLHASSVEEAMYRVYNSFPLEAQEYVRYMLSATLEACIVQRLICMPNLNYCVPHLAIARKNTPFQTAIRENKLSQLEGIMDMSKARGMYTFDRYWKDFIQGRTSFNRPAKVFQKNAAGVEGQDKVDSYASKFAGHQAKGEACGEVSKEVHNAEKDHEVNFSRSYDEWGAGVDEVDDVIKKLQSRN